jgi:hypothetical protein
VSRESKSTLTTGQKVGYALAFLAVVIAVGAFMFWPQIQVRKELQAERDKAARELAAQQAQKDVATEYAKLQAAQSDRQLGEVRFMMLRERELFKAVAIASATPTSQFVQPCHVRVYTQDAGDESPILVFSKKENTDLIKIYGRGSHSENEIIRSNGRKNQTVDFIGESTKTVAVEKPGVFKRASMALGFSEKSVPEKKYANYFSGEAVLEQDFELRSQDQDDTAYPLRLRIMSKFLCDPVLARCEAKAQVNVPGTRDMKVVEHCKDRSSASSGVFPKSLYELGRW